MNKLFITIVLLMLTSKGLCQSKINIKMLTSSFDKKNEKAFLENFPTNFKDFENTFGWNSKAEKPNILAQSAHDYVEYFFTLLKKNQYKKYKSNVIKIATEAKWDADAVNYFQNNLINITESDNDIVNLLNDLDDKKLTSFWEFYFDKEELKYPYKLDTVLTGRAKEKSKKNISILKVAEKKKMI